jgi:hypothetical protein
MNVSEKKNDQLMFYQTLLDSIESLLLIIELVELPQLSRVLRIWEIKDQFHGRIA